MIKSVVSSSPTRRSLLATAAAAGAFGLVLLAAQPTITVPTITLDGEADGVVPATDGTSTAAKFVGGRQHRVIPNVGHNLP